MRPFLVAALLALPIGAARADLPPQAPQPIPQRAPQAGQGTPPAPEPEVDARCTLRVVQGLPQAGAGDKQLPPRLEKQLHHPPFTELRSFKVLSSQEKDLKPASTVEYQLPDGRKATLLYAEHAMSSHAAGRHLVRGTFHYQGPQTDARTMFSVDEGGFFLVAGPRYQGGTLIFAISCKSQK